MKTEQGYAPNGVNDPWRFISITQARCIARYKMHNIPGRPEELESNSAYELGLPRVISFAFAGGEVRIRKHAGANNREWGEVRDFRLRDGWLDEVYAFLDPFFGFVSPGMLADRATLHPVIRQSSII